MATKKVKIPGIYVGYNDGQYEVFQAAAKPSGRTMAVHYEAAIGPFRTMRAAIYMTSVGISDPDCQTVDDAERAVEDLPDGL